MVYPCLRSTKLSLDSCFRNPFISSRQTPICRLATILRLGRGCDYGECRLSSPSCSYDWKGQQQEPQATQEVGGGANTDWERQIADRDARIAEFEGQVAEVAKNALVWVRNYRIDRQRRFTVADIQRFR